MEPLSERDRRTAVLAAAASTALVVGAGWLLIPHSPGPAVPAGAHHTLSVAPDAVAPGEAVRVHVARPVVRGATASLFFERWEAGTWGDVRVLTGGRWSAPPSVGASWAVGLTITGEEVSSWGATIPVDTESGHYLVCDYQQQCGLLDVG